MNIKLFFLYILVSIQADLPEAQCLQELQNLTNCLLCDYFHFDAYYQQNLKLSLQDNILLNSNELCHPKQKKSLSKKIFIHGLTKNSNNIVNVSSYDKFYPNIQVAMQNESMLLSEYLYVKLEIILEIGNHYVISENINNLGNEIFRRALIDITMESEFPDKRSTIFFNTSLFYIFASKNLLVKNIDFIGVGNQEPEYIISKTIFNYGLFNIELVFDNNEIIPNLTIFSTSFKNFKINSRNSYQSLIILTEFSGFVNVLNSNFTNLFIGVLTKFSSNFDILYSYLLAKIQTNTYIFKSEINFHNTSFDSNNNFLISLQNFNGNILMTSINIFNFSNFFYLLFISNDNGFTNTYFNVENATIDLIENGMIFDIFGVSRVDLTNIKFQNISADIVDILFEFKKIGSMVLSNCSFININAFIIMKFYLCEASFFNFYLNNIRANIYAELGACDLFLEKIDIYKIIINDSLIYFFDSINLNLNQINLEMIQSNLTIFNIVNADLFILNEIYSSSVLTLYLFYLENIRIQATNKLMIKNSFFDIIWNESPEVYNIILKNSIINNTTFMSGFFCNRFLKDTNIILKTNFFSTNNFTAQQFFLAFEGLVYIEEIFLDKNFALDSDNFEFFFDIELNCKFFISKSFIRDNGVIKKKNYYLSKVNNCFFSNWRISQTFFKNIIVIVTNLIEMSSGIISAVPHGGSIEISNGIFAFLHPNPNFYYKGFYLDTVKSGIFKNNTFINFKCNDLSFSHKIGSFLLTASPRLNYIKNDYYSIFFDNTFLNCNCFYGGSLAIIGINKILIKNMKSINSKASYQGGHFFFVSLMDMKMINVSLYNSTSDFGGSIYSLNINKFYISFLNMTKTTSYYNGGIFCSLVSNLTIINSFFNSSFSYNKGGVFYLFHSFITINGSIFINSGSIFYAGVGYFSGQSSVNFSYIAMEMGYSFDGGGGIYFDDVDKCKFIYVYATNFFSFLNGAVFFLDVFNFIEFSNIFVENSLTTKNGIIFVKCESDTSYLNLIIFTIINTKSLKGSFIYFLSPSQLYMKNLTLISLSTPEIFLMSFVRMEIELNSLLIINTTTNDSLIYANGINLKMSNAFIYQTNQSFSSFYFQSSKSSFENIIMYKNYNLKSAFECYDSNITIIHFILTNDDKNFNNNSFLSIMIASKSIISFYCGQVKLRDSPNYLIIVQNGELEVKNTNFINNFNSKIVRTFDSNLSLYNCNFFNNSQNSDSDIYVTFDSDDKTVNTVVFKYCKFWISSEYGINLEGVSFLDFLIETCIFLSLDQNQNKGNISALFLQNSHSLNIRSSIFKNFTKNAIYLTNDNDINCKINVSNCSFIENIGNYGSAILIKANLIAVFNENRFINNRAISAFGVGACAVFITQNKTASSIKFLNSYFSNNTAGFVVPTVFSDIPIITQNNEFLNNDDYFNFTKFFYASQLKIKVINSKEEDAISIKSGNTFDLHLEIQDYYNQTLIFDNKTIISLKMDPDFPVFIQENIAQAIKGVFFLQDLLIKVRPNFNFQLKIIFVFAEIKDNYTNQIVMPYQTISQNIKFTSESCLIGEILKDDLSCNICPNGTYSWSDPMLNEKIKLKCLKCPLNADCFQGKFITPQAGYYRFFNSSPLITECFNKDACQGFVKTKYNYFCDNSCLSTIIIHGLCEIGNYGELCFYCEKGFFKINVGSQSFCASCGSVPTVYYIQVVLIVVFSIIFLLANGFSAEKITQSKEQLFDSFNTINKILINHFQQVIILFNPKIYPIAIIPNILDIFSFFSFPLDFLNNRCVLNMLYKNPSTDFVVNALIFTAAPFLISFFASMMRFLISVFLNFIKKNNEKHLSLREVYIKFRLYFVVCIFMYYPPIVKAYLYFFNCQDFDKTHSFLKKSPALVCWEENHLQIVFFFGIPGIFFSAVFSQLYLFMVLKFYQKISTKAKKNMTTYLNKTSNSRRKRERTNLELFPSSRNKVKKRKKIPVFFNTKKPNIEDQFTSYRGRIAQKELMINFQKNTTFKSTKVLLFNDLFGYFDDFNQTISKSNNLSLEDEEKINVLWSLLAIKKVARNNIEKIKVINKTIQQIKDSRIFSFFYKDLKDEFYYWQCAIFLRKFFLLAFVNLSEVLPEEVNMIFLVFIIILSIAFTFFKKPYVTLAANNFEICSLIICLLSYTICLIMNTNSNELLIWILLIFFILVNFIFMICCMIYVMCDMRKKLQNKRSIGSYRNILEKIKFIFSKRE